MNTSSLSTAQVQSFVRLIAFIVSFVVIGLVFGFMLGGLSSAVFGSASILVFPFLALDAWISSIIAKMFYILPEWQSMVLLRLGRFVGVRGAGFIVIPPFIYSVADIVDMRVVTQQVEATATLTKDNVPTKVTAAVEFKVEDPRKATIDVQNFRSSVIWLSTEALKNTIGSLDLKDLLSERDQIAESLRVQIDEGAASYGVDVKAVRITDIDTPPTLIEELAVMARARRAADAKKLQAQAEIEVAEMMRDASTILNESKHGLRLRELQILSEMSKEESSMVIIYPYGDRAGEEIANGSTGLAHQRHSLKLNQ